MALKAFGLTNTVTIVPNSARSSRRANGLEEGECTFEVIGPPAQAAVLLEATYPLGSAHPYRPHLFMENQRLLFTPVGARLECTYAGLQFQFREIPVYELVIGMEESPIETHPKFLTIAGKPSAPVNGALFVDVETGAVTTSNTRGVFERFAPYVGGNLNDLAGVEAFLDPVVTYRQSFTTFSLPSISGFGEITTSLPGPGMPGNLGKRNWLYLGFTYRRRGDPDGTQSRIVYEVNKEWRLSGRNGWNSTIYGS